MSLILEALNRSRQDSQPLPGLATEYYSEPTVGANKWVRALVFALLLAVLMIGWLLWQRPPLPPGVPHQDITVPLAQSPVPDRPPADPGSTEPVGISAAPAVASAPVALAESTPEPEPEPMPASAPARTDPGVAALYGQEPTAEGPAPVPAAATPVDIAGQPATAPAAADGQQVQPLELGRLVAQAENELENARLEPHAVDFVDSLSQQAKDRIPTIWYQRHDYSGVAANSSVILNGKTLRTGESISGGLTVDEILPDSVVLIFQGTRFRLRALNSWINL